MGKSQGKGWSKKAWNVCEIHAEQTYSAWKRENNARCEMCIVGEPYWGWLCCWLIAGFLNLKTKGIKLSHGRVWQLLSCTSLMEVLNIKIKIEWEVCSSLGERSMKCSKSAKGNTLSWMLCFSATFSKHLLMVPVAKEGGPAWTSAVTHHGFFTHLHLKCSPKENGGVNWCSE